ncbi:glutamine amidotransferase [Comamonas serinivorans]|uniref:Glutamine amidotransferase n=1 Tax=Comamonas serinivorans TaxID=1082851 RepID=A0A1Y0EJX6_9BURK|nr:glutamine amidotransferase [Comamonas serinivorans]ARU03943.1 glutamine amidotransferase [Comamonas serinivorans]
MKTAIAVRHLYFEDLGTLGPLLEARGYAVRYLDAATEDWRTVDAAAADLLVVLGGPIGAFDDALYPFLADELAVISERLQYQRPLLGICLGAQLIARALGAGVRGMGVKEIGFAPLKLALAGEASPMATLGEVPVLHWHGDHFEIPTGATRLAGTPVCDNQAFGVGRNVLALQCHLEADPRHIERWLVGHACELAQAGIDPRTLRAEAQALQSDLPRAAQGVFASWLDGIEAAPPRGEG